MKRDTVICDRCGCKAERVPSTLSAISHSPDGWPTFRGGDIGVDVFDLCPDCTVKVERFIKTSMP